MKIILLSELSDSESESLKLKMISYPGSDPVYFKINIEGKDNIIKTGFLVNNCEELKKDLNLELKDKIKIVAV